MCCHHEKVICLNQYELIRKYECTDCGGVMMCTCDESHGKRFLSHQLSNGCILETQERVPVTHGFQINVCNECKGLHAVNAPVSSAPGRTTNILRYYWREISFKTTELFHEKHAELLADGRSEFEFEVERKLIEKEVIKKIKYLHDTKPKYTYNKVLTEPELIERYHIYKHEVSAVHRRSDVDNKVRFLKDSQLLTVEEYALSYFLDAGYSGFESESIPFHVIFGAVLAPFIQDPDDENVRLVQFGSRIALDEGTGSRLISCLLPSDFGTSSYYERRKIELELYLDTLDSIKEIFDYCLETSLELREYLWAHREKDINVARRVLDVLSDSSIKKVLTYICKNYWSNFCGWPDLFIFNNDEFKFIEVKSSNDKLSDDQKNWIQGNYMDIGFKFEIFKVCKQ